MLFNKAVAIFDMDGTLLDSMHCWRLCYKEFLQERNLPIPQVIKHESAEKLYVGKSIQMIMEAYPELGMTREDLNKEFQKIIVRHYSKDILPKNGAVAYLDALRAEGICVGLATATSKDMACIVLDRLGFTQRFDFAYYGTAEYNKSQPEYFLRIAREQGVKPEDCIMFEDAVYAMRSAKKAGMAVCAIEDRFAAADIEEIRQLADRYVQSYADLMIERM